MNYSEAKKYLKRAEKNGHVKYHSGLCCTEIKKRFGGNTTGNNWGINIDGDGSKNHPFGCPKIIWDVETAERMFPTRKYKKN